MLDIKKYSNGKFFDSVNRKYLKPDTIREFINKGEKIKVTFTATGEDITEEICKSYLDKNKGVKYSWLPDSDELTRWISQTIDRRIRKVLGVMNLPTREQIADLNASLKAVDDKIQSLELMWKRSQEQSLKKSEESAEKQSEKDAEQKSEKDSEDRSGTMFEFVADEVGDSLDVSGITESLSDISSTNESLSDSSGDIEMPVQLASSIPEESASKEKTLSNGINSEIESIADTDGRDNDVVAKEVVESNADVKDVAVKGVEKNVSLKGVEAKTTSTKSVEAKTASTKSVEAKTASTKSVEAKTASTKGVEAKTANTKSVKAKSAKSKAVNTKSVKAKSGRKTKDVKKGEIVSYDALLSEGSSKARKSKKV
ncbi:hypothetical protein MTBBW1_2130100 [Desulfamplus magnetovallimortis]|uniref:PHA accumulation regulator DNA-binding N-terminal domain-containing protein n=1 Tax=Desulfamplus magnetovallimortis TaxID=1246637 RepID=A0A1W1HCU4_9BACT|nr:polyhydroxyalkanoate synthesis regulator DNA-binding domain-containing protein [Desulfamplus magnetovallimortis]SLM30205.1 hypothetical protein MTBBW1_2130100 [Desulfamplus magnetovallimortis]